jgi:hypothetical protein
MPKIQHDPLRLGRRGCLRPRGHQPLPGALSYDQSAGGGLACARAQSACVLTKPTNAANRRHGWLLGHQHYECFRYARLPARRLNILRMGEDRPHDDLRTNVSQGALVKKYRCNQCICVNFGKYPGKCSQPFPLVTPNEIRHPNIQLIKSLTVMIEIFEYS